MQLSMAIWQCNYLSFFEISNCRFQSCHDVEYDHWNLIKIWRFSLNLFFKLNYWNGTQNQWFLICSKQKHPQWSFYQKLKWRKFRKTLSLYLCRMSAVKSWVENGTWLSTLEVKLLQLQLYKVDQFLEIILYFPISQSGQVLFQFAKNFIGWPFIALLDKGGNLAIVTSGGMNKDKRPQ